MEVSPTLQIAYKKALTRSKTLLTMGASNPDPMLHTLKPSYGSRKRPKRVARGASAGGGTTAGRGTKGQQSRVGKGRKFGFEGGQTPLIRRQPKLGGFTPPRQRKYEVVTLATLEKLLPAGTYTVADLRARGIVNKTMPVKLIGSSAMTKAYVITVNAASKGAKETVKKAGGSVTVQK